MGSSFHPEFTISIYSLLHAMRQPPLSGQSQIALAHGWVASEARWAVPLTGLVWFSPPASFAADTAPHGMTSERSIR